MEMSNEDNNTSTYNLTKNDTCKNILNHVLCSHVGKPYKIQSL